MLHFSIRVSMIMASKCISKLPRSLPWSASLCSLNHSLEVSIQTHSIMAPKWVSKHTQLRPPSSQDHCLHVHLPMGKCEPVRKTHAVLPDSLVDPTGASIYFQILPATSGAIQSALRLCSSILRCFWKHLMLWRCMQHAPIFDLQDGQNLEQLRPRHSSAGDLLPYPHSGGS